MDVGGEDTEDVSKGKGQNAIEEHNSKDTSNSLQKSKGKWCSNLVNMYPV